MQQFEDTDLIPFPMDGIVVPVIRLTTDDDAPPAAIEVEGEAYRYTRSYPIKGHSAVMPRYLREQMATGKKPLLIERPERFYVYLDA